MSGGGNTVRVAERDRVDAETFAAEVMPAFEPVILRGQVRGWPVVSAVGSGIRATADYLSRFAQGRPLETMIGSPEIGGRFFYVDAACETFNFTKERVALADLLRELVRLSTVSDRPAPAIYANAATAHEHLPGWERENPLGLGIEAPARLWIGNAVQVATHYDTSMNVACVVAGRRRFTLFPPDQLSNLYLAPLDRTMAGPPVSLPDPDAPDFARYPRFAEALAHAKVADLEPGDALFIPPIWWHHVRSFDPLNVLVNYWWEHRSAAAFPALIHAIEAVRDLPPAEKAAWRSWFDQLVFAPDAAAAADHLPEHARTILGPPSRDRSERIRGFLVAMLQRR
jgi:hypothetical protein